MNIILQRMLCCIKSQIKELFILLDGKQDLLISGVNIKTINNESLLGSGNIDISGGSTTTVLDTLTSSSATDALSANQGRVLNVIKADKTDLEWKTEEW